ncbi:MAG: transglycosylase SLT domain-containing protein [Gemmatimonadetes bacterium]|nr:transglycosylase SLT domain-containing protein [Gemmatimonadota bacterium]
MARRKEETTTAHRPSPLRQWERETIGRWNRVYRPLWSTARWPLAASLVALAAFAIGQRTAPTAVVAAATPAEVADLRELLSKAQAELTARWGELELARLELTRVNRIMTKSARYGIPADLAGDIYSMAVAEGIEPNLAFKLVRVESGFARKAVSPVGAVGLTQVMPSTAFGLDPRLGYRELFERETNLRLGFRYLRIMLDKYDGDWRLALLAYNRGPATVDSIRRFGGDPANGYDRAVLAGQD